MNLKMDCVVLVVNKEDFEFMVDIVDGKMHMGIGSPFCKEWLSGRHRELPMLLHFSDCITYSNWKDIDQFEVISSSQFLEQWNYALELFEILDNLEFKVGDSVVLTNERPARWNDFGAMDSFLGSTQVITSIDEPMGGFSEVLVVEFEDSATHNWCFRYDEISHLLDDEPMVMVIQYPRGKGIDWKLDEWHVIIPEEYEDVAEAYAVEQFDKIHSNIKIYGIYEK